MIDILASRSPRALPAPLALLLLCTGCGDDEPDTTADASSGAQGQDAAAPTDEPDSGKPTGNGQPLFGEFAIKFIAAKPATATAAAKPPTTSIVGKLADAEAPQAVIWELADSADGCELRTPRIPFCDPKCGGVATCTEDDTCVDNPVGQDIGAVDVDGLGPTPFSMKVVADNYQYVQSSSWAFPPCVEGEPIALESQARAATALALQTNCIAPLELTNSATIARGKPLALTWAKPGQPDAARVFIELDISHHGGAKGVVQCDVADTGAFAIPASLVDQLVDLGVAGFPTVLTKRYAIGHGDTPQTEAVALSVSASIEQPVEIPGLVSCASDAQCDDGETCQPDATCK